MAHTTPTKWAPGEMSQMSPDSKMLQSQRSLSRLRVYPTGQPDSWLVVGTKGDRTVHAVTFRQLLHEVRDAKRVTR